MKSDSVSGNLVPGPRPSQKSLKDTNTGTALPPLINQWVKFYIGAMANLTNQTQLAPACTAFSMGSGLMWDRLYHNHCIDSNPCLKLSLWTLLCGVSLCTILPISTYSYFLHNSTGENTHAHSNEFWEKDSLVLRNLKAVKTVLYSWPLNQGHTVGAQARW